MIVCATLVLSGRVLLVRHSGRGKADYGHWLLPAGRVERGESLEEALRREMKEEIGLGIRILRSVDERVDPYTGDRLVNLLCVTSTPNFELSEELEEAGWFGPDEIEEIDDIHPGLKRFLLDGLRKGTFS